MMYCLPEVCPALGVFIMILLTKPIVLIALCAISYASATVAMKSAAHTPNVAVLAVVAICLTLAVVAEVMLMRNMAMGLTYVAILGAETVLVLTCS